MTDQNKKQLVDAGSLAIVLGVTTDMVNKLHREGMLPAYRAGKKQLRFDVAECLARLRADRGTKHEQEHAT